MTTLAITTLVLLAAQIGSGTGIPPSALGLPLAFALLAVAAAGVGAFVGALAILFTDALEMTRVALSLAALLTPVFYPLSIVPDRFQWAIELNPIYQFLVLFRDLAYGGGWPGAVNVAVCVVIAAAAARRGRAGVGARAAGDPLACLRWGRRSNAAPCRWRTGCRGPGSAR